MDIMDIEKEVKAIIAEELGVELKEIKLESSFARDLGADSLDIVETVMELEDKLGIEIPDEDIREMTTVGEIIEYIKEKKGVSK